MLLQSIKLLL